MSSHEKKVSIEEGDVEAHVCFGCKCIKVCNSLKCDCFVFGREFWCNEICKDDYLTDVKYKQLASKCCIPCDLHVYFDLETSGFELGVAEVIEIAAVVDPYWLQHNGNKQINNKSTNEQKSDLEYESLVKNKRPLNPSATRVNGITQDMIDKDGKSLIEVVSQFFIWVEHLVPRKPAKIYLTAYNAHKFDGKFLMKMIQDSKIDIPDGLFFFVSDSLAALRTMLDRPYGYGTMSLESVFNRLVTKDDKDKEIIQTHRARGDTIMQIDIVNTFNTKMKNIFYQELQKNGKLISEFEKIQNQQLNNHKRVSSAYKRVSK